MSKLLFRLMIISVTLSMNACITTAEPSAGVANAFIDESTSATSPVYSGKLFKNSIPGIGEPPPGEKVNVPN